MDRIEVTALMDRVEVWPCYVPYSHPLIWDQCRVSMAHQDLAQHFNAMILKSSC